MTDNSREGWIDHDGGPNPIPGQWANIRQRGYADQDDQIWEADFQQWRFKDYDPQPCDIIAYRIVTAAEGRGDGNEAEGVVTPKPDELAIAVERVTGCLRRRHEHWIKGTPMGLINPDGLEAADLIERLTARLASQEETIRADGEALKPFARAGELFDDYQSEVPACIYRPAAGDEYALDSDHLRAAAARLSARQEGK